MAEYRHEKALRLVPKTTSFFHERKEEFVAACSEMMGRRFEMEDAHSVYMHVPGFEKLAWFAVFDGHGGSDLVAKTSSEKLLGLVVEHENMKKSRSAKTIKAALEEGFLKLDSHLRELEPVRTRKDRSGSAAIGVMVTPTSFVTANCGDSRAVLIKKSGVVPLSWDHKPANELERKRIVAAGGDVYVNAREPHGRLNGEMALSRALGDFKYKRHTRLPPHQQQMTAFPDVHIQRRDLANDEYLIVACDGLWDVFSNEEVCEWIKATVAAGCPSVDKLCEELLHTALEKKSLDNISAILVRFPAAHTPSEDVVVAWQKRKISEPQPRHNIDSD